MRETYSVAGVIMHCPCPIRRWGEVSGKHIELRVGDIVDFDFLAGVFKVSVGALNRLHCLS